MESDQSDLGEDDGEYYEDSASFSGSENDSDNNVPISTLFD